MGRAFAYRCSQMTIMMTPTRKHAATVTGEERGELVRRHLEYGGHPGRVTFRIDYRL
jgi:hypothetical protein